MKTKAYRQMAIRFLPIFFLLFFSGCKTTKTAVKTAAKSSSVVNVDTHSSINDKQHAEINTRVSDKGNIAEVTDEVITTITLSAPDSIGKQYKKEITSIKRTIRRGENKNIETKKTENKTSDLTTQYSNKSNLQVKKSEKTDEKNNTETKAPAGVSWGMIILTAGLLFLFYLILKKYRIL